MTTVQLYWRLFEVTGSITAYLLYKQLEAWMQ